ncbi:MAG TPA: alpha/beta hydrolase [Frankiaceae bacterium]|nr:alpha/beta hydrolase [Frankiaceae bacterium]
MPIGLTLRVARSMFTRPGTRSYGPDRNQVADFYLPSGTPPDGGFPVAVLLHGGYWRTQYGKNTCRPLAERLRSRGFAVWNVEYRRVGPGRKGGGGWPATFDDVATALDLLARLPEPLDLSDVTVLGHSAGGQLALWAARRTQLTAGAVGADPVVRPARVIALAPVTHLAGAGDAALALMGSSRAEDPDGWQQADPSAAPPPPVPTLVVHGRDDQTISVARSEQYVTACRAAGAPVELADPADEGHMHVILPTSRCWTAVEDWLRNAREGLAQRPNR